NGRLKTFADGGFSSKPTSAHIAPAGSYVMYAERETGGEAFIPLAASKRARSERVLQDVAKRFGWNVSQYADGGVTATTTNTTGASVSIGQMITSDPQEAIRELRRSQA